MGFDLISFKADWISLYWTKGSDYVKLILYLTEDRIEGLFLNIGSKLAETICPVEIFW